MLSLPRSRVPAPTIALGGTLAAVGKDLVKGLGDAASVSALASPESRAPSPLAERCLNGWRPPASVLGGNRVGERCDASWRFRGRVAANGCPHWAADLRRR